MHFNELSIKTRQLSVTIIGAVLAFSITMGEKLGSASIHLCGWSIKLPAISFLFLMTAALVYFLRMLDIDVYHRLLRGAVKFNEDLESRHLNKVSQTPLGLTQHITAEGRQSGVKINFLGNRVAALYNGTIVVLLISAVAVSIYQTIDQ